MNWWLDGDLSSGANGFFDGQRHADGIETFFSAAEGLCSIEDAIDEMVGFPAKGVTEFPMDCVPEHGVGPGFATAVLEVESSIVSCELESTEFAGDIETLRPCHPQRPPL